MMTAAAVTGGLTVTQRLVETAAARASRLALLGGTGLAGGPCSYPDLARAIQRAAAGLAWRGVRPRDVVGIWVADAGSYLVACHAVRAAEAVPSPVASGRTPGQAAGQLADCGARVLITSQSLAPAALAAADRSWVRQIISFGEAPGATPFSALLSLGSMRPAPARAHDLALLPYLDRADGTLGQAGMTHVELDDELIRLATAPAALTECDVVLAAPPAGDGRAYTALLDHALMRGATIAALTALPPPGREAGPALAGHGGTAAIVPAGAELPDGLALRVLPVDC